MGLIISSPLLDLDELNSFENSILKLFVVIEGVVAIYLLGFLMWVMNKS